MTVPATYKVYINDIATITEFGLKVDLDQYKRLKDVTPELTNVSAVPTTVPMINLDAYLNGDNELTIGEGANSSDLADLLVDYMNSTSAIAATAGSYDLTIGNIPVTIDFPLGEGFMITCEAYYAAQYLATGHHFGLATFTAVVANHSTSTPAQIDLWIRYYRSGVDQGYLNTYPITAFVPPTSTTPIYMCHQFGFDSQATGQLKYDFYVHKQNALWANWVYARQRHCAVYRVGRHDHDTIDPTHDHLFTGEDHTHTLNLTPPTHIHDETQDPHPHAADEVPHEHTGGDNVVLMDSYPATVVVKVNGTTVTTDPGGSKKTLTVDITSYLQTGENTIEVYSETPGAVYAYGNYMYYG